MSLTKAIWLVLAGRKSVSPRASNVSLAGMVGSDVFNLQNAADRHVVQCSRRGASWSDALVVIGDSVHTHVRFELHHK